MDGSLHRISAMRAKSGQIYGLTLRVGRAVYGNTKMLTDILLAGTGSVLVLGSPGCGKTTIVREAARVRAAMLEARSLTERRCTSRADRHLPITHYSVVRTA